tara:strand:+ start:227 stop:3712 length:3486 start_codon:yes stop_codon:yes gene_type:complete
MSNYECYKCKKNFQQKGHLHNHLNRKKTCQKCDKNFKTNYAYIDGKAIHVKDYIKKKEQHLITCNKGHKLVLVNGQKIKCHFRHKNSDDVGGYPMTDWHANWQSKFPVTEIWYRKKEGQIKDRRADIVIEKYNMIIEIQHSNIDDANVTCRDNDYKLHNKELIWVVDGNTPDVKLEELSNGQFLIIFNEDWKYKSFSHTYDFILLDISEKIFKIPVKKVTTTMIKLKEYKLIDDVVSKLQTNPKKVWDLWEDDNSCKCNLILLQKGAGNGKTYGLWKEVLENPDKEIFIILATKHSEKAVILNELKDQKKRNEFHIKQNVHNEEIKGIPKDNEVCKQYNLKYSHKTNDRKVTVIIATVASFYYNITTMNVNCSDPFSSLVPNFMNEGATKVNSNNGAFRFAGERIYLNKKTQIWFDEAQDLRKNNIDAMTKLMLSYNVDIGVVGDKLQSLSYEENVFTVLDNINIPNVTMVRPKPTNINRRIKSIGLKDIPNEIVKFSTYNLPEISIENEEKLDKVDEQFELLRQENPIYANDYSNDNIDKVGEFCNKIIKKFEKEIKENNYLPYDFMVISPILSGRIELVELKSKLENMWINLFNDDDYVNNIDDDFWKENNHNKLGNPVEYVQLHKSENGKAINLSESEMKTRIVSNVTSKGDGRNVVFCLNITERTLKLVSGNEIGLRYESHLHVPVTRAIRKVYFQLTENGDDIHKRFKSRDNVYFIPEIKNNFQINKLIDYIGDDKVAEILATNEIKYKEENKDFDTKKKVDFTDHCSRYAVWKTLLHFHLNKRLKGHSYQTYSAIIHKIPIGTPESVHGYWKYLNTTGKMSPIETLQYIPLINYDNKFYKGFATKIKDRMQELKKKLEYTSDTLDLKEEDYLCLSYMVNINRYKKYTPFNINELYSIINRIQKEDTSTQSFYSKIKPAEKTCNKMIDSIEEKYGKLDWNIEHAISFEGNTDDFNIRKSESVIIGNNDTYVVDVIMKTSFSEINFFSVMKEILLNRFVIYNPENKKEKSKNKERFANKKLITYILVLETNEYKEFDWDWDKCDGVKEIVKDGVESYFSSFHDEIFYFCNKICKNWSTDDKLKTTKNSPFQYIIEMLKTKATSSYILKFIEYLEDEFKINKSYIQDVINTKDIFIEKIGEHLRKSINIFFDEVEYTF